MSKKPVRPPRATIPTEKMLIGIPKLKIVFTIKRSKIPKIEFTIICSGFFKNLIKR
jgi:hypothetical protein